MRDAGCVIRDAGCGNRDAVRDLTSCITHPVSRAPYRVSGFRYRFSSFGFRILIGDDLVLSFPLRTNPVGFTYNARLSPRCRMTVNKYREEKA